MEQMVRIDNMLIREIIRQDFDAIKTVTDNSKYMVNVKINDIQEAMLLDTGSSFTLMARERNDRFLLKEMSFSAGNKPILKTITNDQIMDLFPAVADTLKVGRTVIKPWPFILSNEFVTDTVLGCDFMHFTNAIFICNAGVLFFSTNHIPVKNIGDILKDNGYREIDLLMANEPKYVNIRHHPENENKTLDSGVLLVPVVIDDIIGYCVIDTGADSTIVNRSRVEKKYWEISNTGSHLMDAKGNERRVQTINLGRFVVGDIDVGKNIEIAFLEMQGKQYINPKNEEVPILGNIGVDFLRKYNAIIDFGNRKLYLQD